MAPEVLELLKKMGQADLDILAEGLVPALFAEIKILSPDSLKPAEDVVLAAIEPVAQAALKSLIGKVVL